jgi:hypothetical protein
MAGVLGVGVAVATGVVQTRLARTTRSKVSAELGYGQLGADGAMLVEFESGKTDVIAVPVPNEGGLKADRKKPQSHVEHKPVNAIFIRNRGGTAVTVSRCQYVSELGDTGFKFEPQPAASPRGDHLPKRLEPGEDALVIHDLVTMRVFLNQILRDHGVDTAVFGIVLTLGHGVKVLASPGLLVQADMSEEEIAAAGTRLVRQKIGTHPTFAKSTCLEHRRWNRKTRNL